MLWSLAVIINNSATSGSPTFISQDWDLFVAVNWKRFHYLNHGKLFMYLYLDWAQWKICVVTCSNIIDKKLTLAKLK